MGADQIVRYYSLTCPALKFFQSHPNPVADHLQGFQPYLHSLHIELWGDPISSIPHPFVSSTYYEQRPLLENTTVTLAWNQVGNFLSTPPIIVIIPVSSPALQDLHLHSPSIPWVFCWTLAWTQLSYFLWTLSPFLLAQPHYFLPVSIPSKSFYPGPQ